MNDYRDWDSSEKHRPVTWVNGYPIFAAHFVVLVYCVLMVVTAILGTGGLFQWLAFSSDRVLAGEVWRVFTYGLFNPPSLGFAIDMVMLVWFGRELEKTFGRRLFAFLYGGIYLVPPIVLALVGLVRPMTFFGQPGTLALFVGFATLHPGAVLLFNILARWAAIVLVGLYTLIAISERNWIALILLWSTCGYAHLFVRFQQGALTLPRFRLPRRKPELHVLPDPAPARTAKPDATMAEVDALLDKIAKSGIASLTAAERARLDAARASLIKRGDGRG